MQDMKIKILGEEWNIKFKTEEEDNYLKEVNGYCDHTVKTIIVAKLERQYNSYEDLEKCTRKIIRHELIHAFLDESGLMENSDWARNEEMVDWFAIQFPKIKKLFKTVGVEE